MDSVYPNLDRELKNRKITKRQLAKAIGLSSHAIYRRFQGYAEWKLTEMVAICVFFGTDDALQLFLRLDTIT